MISRRGFLRALVVAPLAAYLPIVDHAAPLPPEPVFAPASTVFTLGDGTKISLADWIDDRVYGTIEIQLDKRNFGGAIEPFVARRRGLR